MLTRNDDDHGDQVNDKDGVVVLLLEQESGERDGHCHGLLAVRVTPFLPVLHRLNNKKTIPPPNETPNSIRKIYRSLTYILTENQLFFCNATVHLNVLTFSARYSHSYNRVRQCFVRLGDLHEHVFRHLVVRVLAIETDSRASTTFGRNNKRPYYA